MITGAGRFTEISRQTALPGEVSRRAGPGGHFQHAGDERQLGKTHALDGQAHHLYGGEEEHAAGESVNGEHGRLADQRRVLFCQEQKQRDFSKRPEKNAINPGGIKRIRDRTEFQNDRRPVQKLHRQDLLR